MIATIVVKGITGGQRAFAVFDDGRNDCTSLWREWKIFRNLTLTTWRRDTLMSTQHEWCRSWRGELLGRKEGKSSALDTSQTVTKLRNIPLFKVFNLIPKIFSNALVYQNTSIKIRRWDLCRNWATSGKDGHSSTVVAVLHVDAPPAVTFHRVPLTVNLCVTYHN